MKSGIYQIVNIINGKKYIGSAVDILNRWNMHKRQLRCNKHVNIHLQRAWNKYGSDNFKFEILLNCKKKELIEYEQLHFDELNPSYNILKIAGSPLGFKHSKESRLKMSTSAKKRIPTFTGRKHTEESRIKMTISAKNNPNLYWTNKTLSEEHKEKISNSHKGKPLSKYHKNKISNSNKGRCVSEETREKIRTTNTGHIVSIETRKKISTAGKGRVVSDETRLKRSLSMKRTIAIKNITKNWGCPL